MPLLCAFELFFFCFTGSKDDDDDGDHHCVSELGGFWLLQKKPPTV